MKKTVFSGSLILALVILHAGLALAAESSPLADAIAKQLEMAPQSIDMQASPGYLAIPGGPQTNMLLAFGWALWVGWIFSTVGAFGGVMAGVGHMSVHGLGAYAKSFGQTPLNKSITDSVRASNQMLAGLSAALSTFSYYRLKRIVLPLGIALGLGSIVGAFMAVKLTAGKLNFSSYQGYFGLFVLVLGCYLIWETSPAGQRSKAKAKAAAKAFEESVRDKRGDGVAETGVRLRSISLRRCVFTFCGVEFSFNPVLPFVGGIVISSIAAFLGVGGGFLLVPFLTSITQLPMYLAAGTSALAVLVSMITGITTLLLHGVTVDWSLVGLELAGIAVGSLIGPYTSRFFSDIWLKRLFIVLALYVGTDYVLRGFFNYRIFG
ncbi:sulfite exporter TauE/SafE family protein [uncultured Desulfovibrio sp.]|uniref:sulfite exporter TauE/SafE family protein n=1 Tax=uncultured Desulfovibrio sp. TaxID=167968 RepID=UPI0026056AA4|nr:sulfite exporter TauE/SafE family protein [uncultured Desulfovibrio sp.]